MYPPYLIWCGGYLCFWNIYSIVSFTMQLCGYVWSYAHHFDLYAAIRLFSAMGYWTGSFADNVSCLTSDGVLQQNRSLRSFLGVKLHVSVNCWSKGLLICYLVHTVHFRFYDSPQPFCRTIIYAMSHSGHGLFHALILELCLEWLAATGQRASIPPFWYANIQSLMVRVLFIDKSAMISETERVPFR